MIHKTFTKATLLVSTLTLISTATLANAPKTGFYLGAALGGSALTGDNKFTASRVDPVLAIPVARFFSVELNGKNIDGDLFIGYGKRFNCFNIAGELFTNFASLKSKKIMDITAQNTGDMFTTTAKWSWGGFVNIGYFVQAATKLYIKLGLESRRFSMMFAPGISVAPYAALNKSYRTTAFVPGFGLETDINPRLSLRTEYRIAMQPARSFNNTTNPNLYTVARIKPTIHNFNLGLLFKI